MTEPKRCCDICTRRNRCKYSKDENMIGCAKFKKAKPMTNEEYIRSCSGKELAEFLTLISVNGFNEKPYGEHPTDYIRRWLKEEHHGC